MKILCFAGALRTGSVSKLLVQEAVRGLRERHRLTADHLDLRDYDFPIYDSDIEARQGIPDAIHALGARVAAANALVIASPEYNGGISSVLKTSVDWLSRLKPSPLQDKFLLLLSASPGNSGGMAGLLHTRVPFDALGVHVFPKMVAIPQSQNAFDENGRLREGKAAERLGTVLDAFVRHVENHHPLPARDLSLASLV